MGNARDMLGLESEMINWRHKLHANPETAFEEHETSRFIADTLESFGLDVRRGIGKTGVVARLARAPGRSIGLRADMDALPVIETVDLPFASKVKFQYKGQEIGVMHACGHDAHIAVLMAVADVLSKLKGELPGSVKFIFQPAEEGAPDGEEGGAFLMIKEGVLESPPVDAIFGLHVCSVPAPLGTIIYRPGPVLASADRLTIIIKGSQTHGGTPWRGIDPVVVAAQVIMGLQTIISRQTDLTAAPAVITIGSIHGGNRPNIIPEKVEMDGSIRVLDPKIQMAIHDRIRKMVFNIADSSGAAAEVNIKKYCPVTVNDGTLTQQMIPTLERVSGKDKVIVGPQMTGSEDFAFFQEKIPGLYFFLNAKPEGGNPVANHSPNFYIDESALLGGIRAMAYLAVDFLAG